ncbi:MAG: ABC transporter substrate-binding protein [Acidobacteria bacterium]|jgi:NitT/TauT family transport system substrate-binding protein|nr:ABC transporter substrate-binding protein [Acidobacteriota bacterium]
MNRKFKRKFSFALFLIVIFALIIAGIIVKRPGGNSRDVFRIGIVSWVGFGPFYIAEEMGFFKEEGVNAEIWKIDDDGALRSSLTSGELQGIIGSLDSLASGIANGLKTKVVLKVDESVGSDGIVAANYIKSIKELKNKKIAFPKGVPSHFFLLNILKKEGMSSRDIIPVYMEAGDAAVAFMAGNVDAAVTWEPWLSKANQPQFGHMIISSKEAPGIIADFFSFSPDTIQNRKKEAAAVLKAWFRALEFLKEKPGKGCEIIGRNLGIKADEVKEMLTGLHFTSLAENIAYFNSGKFGLCFDEAVEIYRQEGLLNSAFPGSQAYDNSFLNTINK